MTSLYLPLLVVFGAGYLFGSVPFGLLLTRAAGLGDVRNIGSGNFGATNVLRTGNKSLAALTLLLDILKGTAAVVFAGYVLIPKLLVATLAGAAPSIESQILLVQVLPWAAGLGAFLGHVFPVWLGFKGGKGVATFIGVLIATLPTAAAVFCIIWLATAAVSRFSSLSALVATMLTFIYSAVVGGPFVAPVMAVMSSILFWKHRENIRRLMAGKESRIGAKD